MSSDSHVSYENRPPSLDSVNGMQSQQSARSMLSKLSLLMVVDPPKPSDLLVPQLLSHQQKVGATAGDENSAAQQLLGRHNTFRDHPVLGLGHSPGPVTEAVTELLNHPVGQLDTVMPQLNSVRDQQNHSHTDSPDDLPDSEITLATAPPSSSHAPGSLARIFDTDNISADDVKERTRDNQPRISADAYLEQKGPCCAAASIGSAWNLLFTRWSARKLRGSVADTIPSCEQQQANASPRTPTDNVQPDASPEPQVDSSQGVVERRVGGSSTLSVPASWATSVLLSQYDVLSFYTGMFADMAVKHRNQAYRALGLAPSLPPLGHQQRTSPTRTVRMSTWSVGEIVRQVQVRARRLCGSHSPIDPPTGCEVATLGAPVSANGVSGERKASLAVSVEHPLQLVLPPAVLQWIALSKKPKRITRQVAGCVGHFVSYWVANTVNNHCGAQSPDCETSRAAVLAGIKNAVPGLFFRVRKLLTARHTAYLQETQDLLQNDSMEKRSVTEESTVTEEKEGHTEESNENTTNQQPGKSEPTKKAAETSNAVDGSVDGTSKPKASGGVVMEFSFGPRTSAKRRRRRRKPTLGKKRLSQKSSRKSTATGRSSTAEDASSQAPPGSVTDVAGAGPCVFHQHWDAMNQWMQTDSGNQTAYPFSPICQGSHESSGSSPSSDNFAGSKAQIRALKHMQRFFSAIVELFSDIFAETTSFAISRKEGARLAPLDTAVATMYGEDSVFSGSCLCEDCTSESSKPEQVCDTVLVLYAWTSLQLFTRFAHNFCHSCAQPSSLQCSDYPVGDKICSEMRRPHVKRRMRFTCPARSQQCSGCQMVRRAQHQQGGLLCSKACLRTAYDKSLDATWWWEGKYQGSSWMRYSKFVTHVVMYAQKYLCVSAMSGRAIKVPKKKKQTSLLTGSDPLPDNQAPLPDSKTDRQDEQEATEVQVSQLTVSQALRNYKPMTQESYWKRIPKMQRLVTNQDFLQSLWTYYVQQLHHIGDLSAYDAYMPARARHSTFPIGNFALLKVAPALPSLVEQKLLDIQTEHERELSAQATLIQWMRKCVVGGTTLLRRVPPSAKSSDKTASPDPMQEEDSADPSEGEETSTSDSKAAAAELPCADNVTENMLASYVKLCDPARLQCVEVQMNERKTTATVVRQGDLTPPKPFKIGKGEPRFVREYAQLHTYQYVYQYAGLSSQPCTGQQPDEGPLYQCVFHLKNHYSLIFGARVVPTEDTETSDADAVSNTCWTCYKRWRDAHLAYTAQLNDSSTEEGQLQEGEGKAVDAVKPTLPQCRCPSWTVEFLTAR